MENPFEEIFRRLDTIEQKVEKMHQSPKNIENEAHELPATGGIDLAVKVTSLKKSTVY